VIAEDIVGDLSFTSIALLLRRAEVEAWTGRLVLAGDRPATLVFSAGRLCFAGVAGWAPLMVRLAEDELFSPEEWATTLQSSSIPPRWTKLVSGDVERLGRIQDQVRDDIVVTLEWIAPATAGSFCFSPSRPHPFGVLLTMRLDEAAQLARVPLVPESDPFGTPHAESFELLRAVNAV
jgi:hypothetical protein